MPAKPKRKVILADDFAQRLKLSEKQKMALHNLIEWEKASSRSLYVIGGSK